MVLLRRVSAAVAALCIFVTAIGTAHAAGSFAVGACGAFGYGYDYRKLTEARAVAMKKCVGQACKVVGDIKRGCAAQNRIKAGIVQKAVLSEAIDHCARKSEIAHGALQFIGGRLRRPHGKMRESTESMRMALHGSCERVVGISRKTNARLSV